MLLRYLKPITLKEATKVKKENGTYVNTYTNISNYKAQIQNISGDEVSATIYGARINNMLRISTPLSDLEKYLLPRVDNINDNISKYYIQYGSKLYKITSVTSNSILVEFADTINQMSL